MTKRALLLPALIAGLMVWSADALSAQQRGPARGAAASAGAVAAGASSGQATGRPTALPAGIANRMPGGVLPPGIARTRQAPSAEPPAPEPETEPAPEPEPEPEGEECSWVPTLIDGAFWLVNSCTGERVPVA